MLKQQEGPPCISLASLKEKLGQSEANLLTLTRERQQIKSQLSITEAALRQREAVD